MSGLSSDQRRALEALRDACASCANSLGLAGEALRELDFHRRYLVQAEAWRRSAHELGDFLEGERRLPGPAGGVVASLRRTWMTVKSAAGDTGAIVLACDRWEAEARERLVAAEKLELPPLVRQALERVRRRIAPHEADPGDSREGPV